jgi:hypothetical protein
MSTDKDTHEQAVRAADAEQILANPAFRQAWADVRGALMEQIVATDSDDVERVRGIMQRIKALDGAKRMLESYLFTGRMIEEREHKRGFFDRLKPRR